MGNKIESYSEQNKGKKFTQFAYHKINLVLN